MPVKSQSLYSGTHCPTVAEPNTKKKTTTNPIVYRHIVSKFFRTAVYGELVAPRPMPRTSTYRDGGRSKGSKL